MSYEYFNTLNDESRTRYLKRLEFAKLKEYPYRFPADTWKDNPTLWPELEYPEIYDYLINTPGVYILKKLWKVENRLKHTINLYPGGLGSLNSCKPKKVHIC